MESVVEKPEVEAGSAVAPKPHKTFKVDSLNVEIYGSLAALAKSAARVVRDYLVDVIQEQGAARVILATGNSQITFLNELIGLGGVDWEKTTLFHMDEYLGISEDHPASFRRYMKDRVERLIEPSAFHYLEGDAPLPLLECDRYTRLLKEGSIDLCCLGIGENGHIAFNDPPVADFEDPYWVKLVQLDEACKLQQVNEDHFPSLETVPPYAFTLTIPALCSAKKMICLSPEKRKAKAVRGALGGEISTDCPASYLRRQSQCTLFLDNDSASLL